MRYAYDVKLRETLGATALLLGSLPSCNVGHAADTAQRVKQFEAMLSEELGTEVELQCPAMVDRSHIYCTAVVPAKDDLAFPVRVVSRGQDLDYSTKLWVSGTRMVDLGTHALEEKFDIAVTSLTCPTISHMPEGTTVRCDASAEGVAIPVEVSMVVKVRKLSFQPVGGVVLGEHAARVAHEKFHEQGVHAKVTCARPVVVSVPGTRFECKALLPDQTISTIHYLITSTEGTFELGTEPPQGEGIGAPAPPEGTPPNTDHDRDHGHAHAQ